MHLNKQQQHNKLLHNEKNDQNYDLNYTNKTATTSLEIEATSDKIRNLTTLGDTFTGTANSCTSSTDSGVNVSDSEIPPSPSPTSQILSSSSPFASTSQSTATTTANPFNQQYYRNNKTTNADDDKNNINNFHDIVDDDDDDEVVQTLNNSKNIDKKYKSEESKYREQPQSFVKVAGSSSNENNYNNQTTTIKSENVINFSHPPDTLAAAAAATSTSTTNDTRSRQDHDCRDHPTTTTSSTRSTSPSLSMSSTNSFTHPPSKTHINRSPNVSIRSIDSSVIDSDSDSDLNDDIEGEHENYVIKKLGTQVSYPPKHPDIPNINRGLTVLNQHVTPHGGGGGGQMPPNPIAALSAIGDSLGAAQALGPVPANSAIANNRPQIGSIALSNSSDVTFGDKHFYEGPVTIQQFLIDGRDKWKESNGKENPLFESDNNDTPRYAKDINPPAAAQPSKLYGYISKRKMYVIAGALSVMTLLIVAAILGSEALNDNKSKIALGNSEESRKNIPINSTIDVNVAGDECDVNNGSLCLLDRHDWQGHPQKQKLDGQKLPLHRAIISHTASEACDSLKECQFRVRVIQEFHMNSFGWDDIGYNFLISSDGRVYVGRGWDDIGAHTKGYNSDSVGIAFIGTYMSVKPTEAQLKACQLLLEEGVRLKKLVPNYHLYGARQFAATESPGDMLYKIIKTQDNVGGGNVLRIVPRDGWLAQPPVNPWVPLELPVDRVIIFPTKTEQCVTQAACTYRVRITQTFNIESQQQDDIIYNFLIGGDGNVYEGRGWDSRGSALKGYNDNSISFAYIGSFKKEKPSGKQLNVTRLLLEEGVRLDKLSSDYRIVGANKLDPTATATSADALYTSFESWPHWSDK